VAAGIAVNSGAPGSKPAAATDKARINLERASILLVDTPLGVDVLSHVFYGFGARNLYRCRSAAEAMEVVAAHQLDLIITEALLPDADAYEFVRAVRQSDEYESNRFVPVMLLSAHTAASKVVMSRDCGANFFVAKPISPRVMMDRLLWVSREKRQYLQTDTYAGPDRRFHDEPLPEGVQGRRRNDPKIDAEEPET